jgi:adenosylcobinamide-phosphate guanylyltransferase
MCGGEGTRLGGDREKPLVRVGGVPMVDRVTRALAESGVESVYAVTAPDAPATAAHLDLPRISGTGEGYVADLERALADARVTEPVLTVAADLPLLDGAAVDRVCAASDGDGLAVMVPVGRKRALGFSVDTTVGERRLTPAGINVVGPGERTDVRTGLRYAANVNRPADHRRAEWLLAGGV